MTFAVPTVLWLAALPFALLVLDASIRAASAEWPRVRRLWAGPGGLSQTAATRSVRRWLLWVGLILVLVAAARPQWGRIEEKTFEQSREVLLALDLSRSMLAEDVRPSRLERAKLLIESLLDRLKGERVGLVLFSGTAFLQSPLSPDYEVLREFLPALGPDYLPEGGTDFDRLLSTTLDSFSNEGGADRFLIVLSDGESQTTDWRARIEKMKQRNIRIITLGIGTENGAVMPAEGGGFVKDERGAVVLSRLQPETLRDLARLTGGTYANAAAWVDLAAVLEQTVERGRQGGFTQRSEVRLQERYQWFLAAGLLALTISFWREFPVRPRVRDLKARVATSAVACAALLSIAAPRESTAAEDVTGLAGLTKTLSEQPNLSASDAGRFANATIDWGTGQKQSGKPIPPSVLSDGFASVDLGEQLDRNAADWPELRRKLEDLARPPDQKEDEKKDEEKQQDEQQKDQQQQQQQGGDQEQEQQDQQDQEQQQQQQDQQNEQEQQQRSGQKAFEDQPPQSEPQDGGDAEPKDEKPQPPQKNMQSVGGEQNADKELEERPELAVPLQKLDRVKQQDSPARLFQLMKDEEPKRPTKKERDW